MLVRTLPVTGTYTYIRTKQASLLPVTMPYPEAQNYYQWARNHTTPPLGLTVTLQSHVIPRCKLIDPKKESIQVINLVIFHQ